MFSTILICSLSVGLSLSLGKQSVEPSADGKTLNIRLGSSAESFAVVELQPKVTFKNLEVLTRYLDLPIQRCFGSARRVILSEQGFNTPKDADGETKQAAGFCYGWKKANALPGIDAFILHRHVDHTHEGGLRLGLWTNKPDSVNTPDGRKLLYEVFHHADADDWQKHFQFALPLIGAKDWNSLP